MQDCGSCKHFVKWKNNKIGGGVCVLLDMRTKTDYGHRCEKYKRIKFHRQTRRSDS